MAIKVELKIRIFSQGSRAHLEKEVNKFIEDRDRLIKKIQLSTCYDSTDVTFTAMIVFEEGLSK